MYVPGQYKKKPFEAQWEEFDQVVSGANVSEYHYTVRLYIWLYTATVKGLLVLRIS